MEEETVKIKWYVDTGLVGSERSDVYDTSMTAEEWAALSSKQQDEIMRDVVFNTVNWGYEAA